MDEAEQKKAELADIYFYCNMLRLWRLCFWGIVIILSSLPSDTHGTVLLVRPRRTLVYVEGNIFCSTLNGNVLPLTRARVKVQCRSKFGEYETLGISNKNGVFRVILQGALGYQWPVKLCKAKVISKTIPSVCREGSDILSMNVRLFYKSSSRIMLVTGPFILKQLGHVNKKYSS
ncbi:uncharacterized protein LOC131035064 isoform X2 [Cryptomeria japonica]|uniref:uncharacterized protein LOC131035064 isoform X2 n=1 Tax=Cryptomeria japonica TaxID=3369 RepID=UPI0027DA312E|nr:uncharacterized protein LOC131035064 isoform X2 [Cryptomeria japonica]